MGDDSSDCVVRKEIGVDNAGSIGCDRMNREVWQLHSRESRVAKQLRSIWTRTIYGQLPLRVLGQAMLHSGCLPPAVCLV